MEQSGEGGEGEKLEREDEGKFLEGDFFVNTPNRGRITTPISKFEDSPVFNYINNLSPLETARTIRISQSFNSYSLSSIPSVFTSPHVSSLKGVQLLRRHSISGLSNPVCSSENGNKIVSNKSEGQKASFDPGGCENQTSNKEKVGKETPKNQNYDCYVPNNSTMMCHYSEGKCVPSELSDNSGFLIDRKEGSFDCVEFYDAADLLVFESPDNTDSLKGYFLKKLDSETRLHLPGTENDGFVGVEIENSILEAGEGELNAIEAAEDVPARTCLDNQTTEVSTEVNANESTSYLPRGMKRRCLVFEGGARRKFLNDNSSSSYSMSPNCHVTSNENQSMPSRPDNNSSKCIFPGIGLHLNALARPSKDYNTANNQETLVNDHSTNVVPDSFANYQETINQSPPLNSSTNGNFGPLDGGISVSEDLNQSTAKRNKRKVENGETNECKRCNCKKSKCLKLYCECFAAGVYCVEPCSCQDCFNKPMHEEAVLATRKQIESRNPLAFAPKVIRITEIAPETVDDLSSTPASARHKRGCNCKKSGCLKKYCECYQGGVGCSINCRCEGCKNVFGRKEGSNIVVTETEVEEMEKQEKSDVDKNLSKNMIQNNAELNPDAVHPETPMHPNRASIHHKPPRRYSMGSSSSTPYGGQKFGIPVFLQPPSKLDKNSTENLENEIPEILRSPKTGIKSCSPNSKRVSSPHCFESSLSPARTATRKLILRSIPSFPSLKD